MHLGLVAVLRVVDAAYCYRESSVVYVSICLSPRRRERCKKVEQIEMLFWSWKSLPNYVVEADC